MTTKEFLTLYRGTTFSRAQEIARTGEISNRAVSMMNVSDELKTTEGYVYLTSNPGNAVYYGNGLALMNKEDQFCIYRCVLDIGELSADMDELNIQRNVPHDEQVTAQESLLEVLICRINRSLVLGTDIRDYLFLPSRRQGYIQSVTDLINLRRARYTQRANDVISDYPPVVKTASPGESIPLRES